MTSGTSLSTVCAAGTGGLLYLFTECIFQVGQDVLLFGGVGLLPEFLEDHAESRKQMLLAASDGVINDAADVIRRIPLHIGRDGIADLKVHIHHPPAERFSVLLAGYTSVLLHLSQITDDGRCHRLKRIESTQNSLVKHWKKLVNTRKERDKTGEFLVEGEHLAEEALKKEGAVLALIVREGVDVPDYWETDEIQMIEITSQVEREITDTEHPQGIYAQCRIPEVTADEQESWKTLLLIDAVQDPGNIGTMIRTADAAGIDAVVLGKGSADPYAPKTVRSAQGSHFHLPVVRGELQDIVLQLKSRGIQVFGTALEGAVAYDEPGKSENFALIVGNEGSGVNPELLAEADRKLMIPLRGLAESLNVAVATGILLYALRA
jgi:RNA methyltransferase, TrmH family